jgi:hypothetical protein
MTSEFIINRKLEDLATRQRANLKTHRVLDSRHNSRLLLEIHYAGDLRKLARYTDFLQFRLKKIHYFRKKICVAKLKARKRKRKLLLASLCAAIFSEIEVDN